MQGAEVDAEDGEGCTALTVALAFGLEGAARALLEAGAGVKAGAGGTGGGKRSGVVVDRTSMSEIVGNVGMRQGMDVMTGRREAVDSMGTKRESMGTKRFGCAAVVHGHHIYAIGGHDESTQLQTVERMDVRTGQWKATDGDVGFGVAIQGGDLEVDSKHNAGLFYFRGGFNNDFKMFAGGTVVDKKLVLFEGGELKAGDVLHFVLRGAVLEVALNDSPFEEAFTELPAGVVPLVQLGDWAQKASAASVGHGKGCKVV
ncbi:hypothetical protein CYMTET_15497 [Cymbomonas tetramitiformis]|uniref:Uncharacterized protein n=1 Tax=Cymbomonas tetramitiformis TaxID=36881 RepID=A0AAE0L8U8_9CHLO|nr:hypothetical protein CYMTET_15497 [Cymbomonas tetramitiformis]